MAMSTNTSWAQPEYLNLNNSALEPSPAPGLQQGPVLRRAGAADNSCHQFGSDCGQQHPVAVVAGRQP